MHSCASRPIRTSSTGCSAADSARQLGEHVALDGATVLDVGGGPGYFADAFRGAGATYVGLEPDAGEMAARGEPQPGTVRASGEALPVRSAAVDVCYSSNVLEHVRSPWTMTAEMVRGDPAGWHDLPVLHPLVRRPGAGTRRRPGTTSAARAPAVATGAGTGQEPKNRFGESLFPVSVGRGAAVGADLPGRRRRRGVPAVPPVVGRLGGAGPGLREIVSWNLVVVMRRR